MAQSESTPGQEKVLVLGSGAREHALGWKMKQGYPDRQVFFAPGNAGTEAVGINLNFGVTDMAEAAIFAFDNQVDLTVVGPEVPLAAGIVDVFEGNDLRIFGPSGAAARIESSKIWSHDFMKRHGIPQPAGMPFREGNLDNALGLLGFLQAQQILYYHSSGDDYAKGLVIKADGLAAGKGVELPDNDRQARLAIQGMMSGRNYDGAGKSILIQSRESGPELSVMAISDGERIAVLPPARDYKRLLDGDMGPNTGGMGAYAPVGEVTPELLEQIKTDILQKAVDGMKEEGYPFKGALYAGLMLTSQGPRVLEFNCRFGDPETLAQLMLLRSDLYPILRASADGNLEPDRVLWRRGSAVSFVLAAAGYPENPVKGDVIHGLDFKNQPFLPGLEVFHAGTKKVGDEIVTNGGRVLAVSSYSDTLISARLNALLVIGDEPDQIGFEGNQIRYDVARDAVTAG